MVHTTQLATALTGVYGAAHHKATGAQLQTESILQTERQSQQALAQRFSGKQQDNAERT